MSILSVLSKINFATLAAAPVIVTGVVAVEALAPDATGAQKLEAVTTGVIQTLGQSSNVTAQSIAASASLVVLLAHLVGAFTHKNKPAAQVVTP